MASEKYKVLGELDVLEMQRRILSGLEIWETYTGKDALQCLYWIDGVREMTDTILRYIRSDSETEGNNDLLR